MKIKLILIGTDGPPADDRKYLKFDVMESTPEKERHDLTAYIGQAFMLGMTKVEVMTPDRFQQDHQYRLQRDRRKHKG